MSEVLIPICLYWLPMLFFFYMGIDVLLRNPHKSEHRLVSLTIGCYFLLFLEEYIRYLLPIQYSPLLAAFWFANVGIAIPGLGFHFLAKLTGLDKRLSRPLYPYIFHVLLLAIPVGIISSHDFISAQQFEQMGIWKWPVYNDAYYGALTASLLISAISITVLHRARMRTSSQEHRDIYKLLEYGSMLTMCWIIIFGYFRFDENIPPYSYLYGGILWCFFLQLAMKKYDFLNFNSHRYEKLFNLNPEAILLVALSGGIKEVNPSARQLFDSIDLDHTDLDALASEELMQRLKHRGEIKELETVIYNGSTPLDVLINGDYVSVDNEPHVILLIRNVTLQKEHQRQIAFLAYHDPLTGLPNRRYFYEKLEQVIQESQTRQQRFMVILIDLDDFKLINDRYGHEAGDRVLRHVALIIKETLGASGMAARLGGDEFVLFSFPVEAELAAMDMVSRLESDISRNKLEYGKEWLAIQLSIGVSHYPQDGLDTDTLLNHADKAMYRIKRSRKQQS